MLGLIAYFAVSTAEADFKLLAKSFFPTLDASEGVSLWCAYIPGVCEETSGVGGAFNEQVKQFALAKGYDLHNVSNSNDCNLYTGPGSQLYYGVPHIANSGLWANSSRIMSDATGHTLIATDVRHLSTKLSQHDMLCPCALGMECTKTGDNIPDICTVVRLSQNTDDMWVVVLVLIAISVVVVYVATD